MEFHPIFEKGSPLNNDLWYVLSASGEHPSMRVGHTASFIPRIGLDGKIYFIASANPDGQLADIYVLDLETFTWDTIDCEFKSRYEHIAFTPDSYPTKIYLLLGAEKSGNVNDVQAFDTVSQSWESVEVKGDPPSARTHHSTAQLGDRVYVFAGGEHGSDPVQDRLVHCFDAASSTWSSVETTDPPRARHGHLLLAHDNKLILHGGMSGHSFFDDLHILDLSTNKWKNVKQRKVFPGARAAHGGVVVGSTAFIFGGMSRDGALDDLYSLDIESFKWQKIVAQGPAPTPRLDFAISCITARVPVTETQSVAEQTRVALEKLETLTVEENLNRLSATDSPQGASAGDSPPCVPNPTPTTERYRTVSLLLVHGGMDTDGEIWDDTLVYMIDSEQ